MSDKDKVQTPGRESNAAQPLNASDNQGGPERYPTVRQDDSVERTGRAGSVTGEGRSFDPTKDAPSNPPQGAGDTSAPASANDGRSRSEGDPLEGKR